MEYVIGDETIIEYDVKLGKKVSISQDIELPVISISHEETPLITPIAFNNIGTSSVDVSFDVSTENATEVVKGLIYSDSPQLDFNDSYKLDYGQGTFNLTIAGLRNNTTYYFKPYALSNLGYKYGNLQSCHTASSPIPEEYQLVEYLESTGTQYINTGYAPLQDDEITAYVSFNNNSNQMMGCFKSSGGVYQRCHFSAYQSPSQIRIFYDTGSGFLSKAFDTEKHVFRFTPSKIYIDSSNANNSAVYPSINFYLFARNNNNNIDNYCFAKVYRFNAVDKADLYPVYRKADDKPGMYDIINHQFYTNAGTGEFVVGPDKEWQE